MDEPVHTTVTPAVEEPCGFLGCPTVIVKRFPWSMCDPCRSDAD